MNERQQDVLRLQPHMIPALRNAFAEALKQLNETLVGLRREGNLSAPWLGDETSQEVAAHYSSRAMDGPQSSYESLVSYRDELGRVHDTLQQMEDDYRRTEGDNAALWGRKA
jgi:cytochrome c553